MNQHDRDRARAEAEQVLLISATVEVRPVDEVLVDLADNVLGLLAELARVENERNQWKGHADVRADCLEEYEAALAQERERAERLEQIREAAWTVVNSERVGLLAATIGGLYSLLCEFDHDYGVPLSVAVSAAQPASHEESPPPGFRGVNVVQTEPPTQVPEPGELPAAHPASDR